MQANSRTVRQSMRCGWEPDAPPHVEATAWQPPRAEDGVPFGFEGPIATTCIGYTKQLPEVIEIGIARAYWSHGELESFCDGKPTEHVKELIIILDGQHSCATIWAAKNPQKHGAPIGGDAIDGPLDPTSNKMQVLFRREGA